MNFDLIYEWLDLPKGGWPPTKDDLFGDISSLSKKDAEGKFLSYVSSLREKQPLHSELVASGLDEISKAYSSVVEQINKRNQDVSKKADEKLVTSPDKTGINTDFDLLPEVSADRKDDLEADGLPSQPRTSEIDQSESILTPKSSRQQPQNVSLLTLNRSLPEISSSPRGGEELPPPSHQFSRGSDLEPPVAPLDTNAPLPPDMPLTSLPEEDELIEPEMAKENSGSSNFFSGLADAINFPTLSGIKSDITNWMHAGVSFDSSPARNISGGDDFNISDATNGLDLSELISLMEENNNLLGEIVDIMSPSNSPSSYDSKQ